MSLAINNRYIYKRLQVEPIFPVYTGQDRSQNFLMSGSSLLGRPGGESRPVNSDTFLSFMPYGKAAGSASSRRDGATSSRSTPRRPFHAPVGVDGDTLACSVDAEELSALVDSLSTRQHGEILACRDSLLKAVPQSRNTGLGQIKSLCAPPALQPGSIPGREHSIDANPITPYTGGRDVPGDGVGMNIDVWL